MKFRPEFFDIFGLGVFTFLIGVSAWGLITGEPLPRVVLLAVLVIGILGLIVDFAMVFRAYFNGKYK